MSEPPPQEAVPDTPEPIATPSPSPPKQPQSPWASIRNRYTGAVQEAGLGEIPDPDAPDFARFLQQLNRRAPALARELAQEVRALSQGMALPSGNAARKRAARARTKQVLFFRQTADGRLVLDKQKAPIYGIGSVLVIGGLLTAVYALPNLKPGNSLLQNPARSAGSAPQAQAAADTEGDGPKGREAPEVSPESRAAVEQAQAMERAQQAAAVQAKPRPPQPAVPTQQPGVVPITSASAPPIRVENSTSPDVYVPSPQPTPPPRSTVYDPPPPAPMQDITVTPTRTPATPAVVPVQSLTPPRGAAVAPRAGFSSLAAATTRPPAPAQAGLVRPIGTVTPGTRPAARPAPSPPARAPVSGLPTPGPASSTPAARVLPATEQKAVTTPPAAFPGSVGTLVPDSGALDLSAAQASQAPAGVPFGGFGEVEGASNGSTLPQNSPQTAQAFGSGLVYERTPKVAQTAVTPGTPRAAASATAGSLPPETPFGSGITLPAAKIGATGPFTDLERVSGTLVTAIYALTGGTVPVLVVTGDGGSFVGVGTINGQLGRVDMSFRRYVSPTGEVFDIDALAYTQEGTNLTQGIPAVIEAAAPTLALDVVQNSASALQQYLMQSLNNQGGTTVLNGGTNTISPNALPPLWQMLAAGAGSTFQLPKTTQSVVRIARVSSSTKMTLIVGLTAVPK